MDSLNLASGDNNKSPRVLDNDDVIPAGNKRNEQPEKDQKGECFKNDAVTPKIIEDNENKLKERIAQCRDIIESLKLELSKEKSKLEKETKSSQESPSIDSTSNVATDQDNHFTGQDKLNADIFSGDLYSSNIYSSSVDDRLNCDESLIEYEKQLQRYQNTLNMAQIEKKHAIRKQMLAKAFKLKLLEVENQCNIELLRVKQSLQCLEPLQMIANKWKTSSNDSTYDVNNFDLIPRFPELSANSGSDINSCRDDYDSKASPNKSGDCAKEDLYFD